MSTLYDTAARVCRLKRGLDRDRRTLETCEAEDEYIVEENIAWGEELLEELAAEFEEQAKTADPAVVRYLLHAMKNHRVESLITQMAHL